MAYIIIFAATVAVVSAPLLLWVWYDSVRVKRLYGRLALDGDFQALAGDSPKTALNLFERAYKAVIKTNFGCDEQIFERRLNHAVKRTGETLYLLDLSVRYQNPLYPDHNSSFTSVSTLVSLAPQSIEASLLVRAKMSDFVESILEQSGALNYDKIRGLDPYFREQFQIAVFGQAKPETINSLVQIFSPLAQKFPFARIPEAKTPYGEVYAYICPDGWLIICSRVTKARQVKMLLESGQILAEELAHRN